MDRPWPDAPICSCSWIWLFFFPVCSFLQVFGSDRNHLGTQLCTLYVPPSQQTTGTYGLMDGIKYHMCQYPVAGIPYLTAARQDPRSYP